MKNYSPYYGDLIINEKFNPIIVHNVGKVGSKTIVESLFNLDNFPYAIYHSHVLSPKILDYTQGDINDNNFNATNSYLNFNLKLSKFINENFHNYKWKVITLIRDPISIILSSFFEFLDTGTFIQETYPELLVNGKLKATHQEFNNFFNSKFAYMTGDAITPWFDKEMKEVFMLDIYEYPFDPKKGYSIIHKDNVELLVIRLEDLNRVFGECLREFLGLEDLEMINDNEGASKHYARYLRFLKKNLQISPDIRNHFYNNRFTSHFYSPEEIDKFSSQWLSPKSLSEKDYLQFKINPENIFDGIRLLKNEVESIKEQNSNG